MHTGKGLGRQPRHTVEQIELGDVVEQDLRERRKAVQEVDLGMQRANLGLAGKALADITHEPAEHRVALRCGAFGRGDAGFEGVAIGAYERKHVFVEHCIMGHGIHQ